MSNSSLRTMYLLVALLLCPFIALLGCSVLQPPPLPINPSQELIQRTQEATVTKVVDGDTIKVEIGGVQYTIRYIGMDTPETVHPQKPVEVMGKEASNKNKELVGEKTVWLERDISDTDRYGRLLRYVWVEQDGKLVMVNAELVRLGYAQIATYPPDVKYQLQFLQLQRQAREQKLGLWAE